MKPFQAVAVAQLAERLLTIQEDPGSIPVISNYIIIIFIGKYLSGFKY